MKLADVKDFWDLKSFREDCTLIAFGEISYFMFRPGYSDLLVSYIIGNSFHTEHGILDLCQH